MQTNMTFFPKPDQLESFIPLLSSNICFEVYSQVTHHVSSQVTCAFNCNVHKNVLALKFYTVSSCFEVHSQVTDHVYC